MAKFSVGELPADQGGRRTLRLQYLIDNVAQSLAGYVGKAGIDNAGDYTDVTEYLTLEPDGDTGYVQLDLPASVTREWKPLVLWDIFLLPGGVEEDAIAFADGEFVVDKAVWHE